MISFFRRTRENLIDHNKTVRYLKYALGEVVLLVIGILIALSINNLNEINKNDVKQAEFLAAIHLEFIENKIQLDTVLKHHRTDLMHCNYIIKYMPIKLEKEVLDSVRFHLQRTFGSWTFNPSHGSINSLISTSSFNIIKNDSLRTLLISWNDLLGDYAEDENYNKNFELGPYDEYFSKNFEWDFDLTDSRFDQKILNSLQFEYMIKTRRSFIENVLEGEETSKLQKALDEIIHFTELKK